MGRKVLTYLKRKAIEMDSLPFISQRTGRQSARFLEQLTYKLEAKKVAKCGIKAQQKRICFITCLFTSNKMTRRVLSGLAAVA